MNVQSGTLFSIPIQSLGVQSLLSEASYHYDYAPMRTRVVDPERQAQDLPDRQWARALIGSTAASGDGVHCERPKSDEIGLNLAEK